MVDFFKRGERAADESGGESSAVLGLAWPAEKDIAAATTFVATLQAKAAEMIGSPDFDSTSKKAAALSAFMEAVHDLADSAEKGGFVAAELARLKTLAAAIEDAEGPEETAAETSEADKSDEPESATGTPAASAEAAAEVIFPSLVNELNKQLRTRSTTVIGLIDGLADTEKSGVVTGALAAVKAQTKKRETAYTKWQSSIDLTKPVDAESDTFKAYAESMKHEHMALSALMEYVPDGSAVPEVDADHKMLHESMVSASEEEAPEVSLSAEEIEHQEKQFEVFQEFKKEHDLRESAAQSWFADCYKFTPSKWEGEDLDLNHVFAVLLNDPSLVDEFNGKMRALLGRWMVLQEHIIAAEAKLALEAGTDRLDYSGHTFTTTDSTLTKRKQFFLDFKDSDFANKLAELAAMKEELKKHEVGSTESESLTKAFNDLAAKLTEIKDRYKKEIEYNESAFIKIAGMDITEPEPEPATAAGGPDTGAAEAEAEDAAEEEGGKGSFFSGFSSFGKRGGADTETSAGPDATGPDTSTDKETWAGRKEVLDRIATARTEAERVNTEQAAVIAKLADIKTTLETARTAAGVSKAKERQLAFLLKRVEGSAEAAAKVGIDLAKFDDLTTKVTEMKKGRIGRWFAALPKAAAELEHKPKEAEATLKTIKSSSRMIEVSADMLSEVDSLTAAHDYLGEVMAGGRSWGDKMFKFSKDMFAVVALGAPLIGIGYGASQLTQPDVETALKKLTYQERLATTLGASEPEYELLTSGSVVARIKLANELHASSRLTDAQYNQFLDEIIMPLIGNDEANRKTVEGLKK